MPNRTEAYLRGMLRSETVRKGEIAVHRTIIRSLELGHTPLRPCVEGARYDLVIDRGAGGLSRVQVKYCNHRPRCRDAYEISLTRHSGGRNRRTYRYLPHEIDAVVALLASHDLLVWVPAECLEGRSGITLRTAPARNGQRALVRMAADYAW